MQDKTLYQQAFEELNAGTIDPALWGMVWTKAGGDENRAKASYVEARVAEIKAQIRGEQKADPPLPSKGFPSQLIGLFGCSITFCIANDAIVHAHASFLPTVQGPMHWISIFASSLGLMLVPGLPLLVTRGSKWGYRIAFLVLCLAGCLAGVGGLPEYATDRQDAIAGYCWTGLVLSILWVCYVSIAASDDRNTGKLPTQP